MLIWVNSLSKKQTGLIKNDQEAKDKLTPIKILKCSHLQFSSVQFSHSVVSNSLQPEESQHARPPCPSPTPGVHSNSRPSSQWSHPAISSSVVPFSSCPQSLPASESFPMRQLFTWGGQSTGVSALASFLPKNTQDWSPLEWTGWISLQSKGLWRVFSNTSSKASILRHSAFFTVQLSHPYMTIGKTIALTRQTFVGKVMSLLLNMLSRLVITFLLILASRENYNLLNVDGNPLQYSCLENHRDGGAWWAAICGVVQSRTRLMRLSSNVAWFTVTFFHEPSPSFFLSKPNQNL